LLEKFNDQIQTKSDKESRKNQADYGENGAPEIRFPFDGQSQASRISPFNLVHEQNRKNPPEDYRDEYGNQNPVEIGFTTHEVAPQ
jgi:hypothetical protein